MTPADVFVLDELPLADLLRLFLPARAAALIAAAGAPLADLARPGFAGEAALDGPGPEALLRLAAAFELGRRRAREEQRTRPRMDRPAEVARLLGPDLRDEPVEVFRAVLLDARNQLLAAPEIHRGTLNSSLVHPREVFRPAVVAAAAALIVVHNHPSGDPEPSPEDDSITRRLARSGHLLGIPLLDHVVIGDGRHVSYRERSDPALDAEWQGPEPAWRQEP